MSNYALSASMAASFVDEFRDAHRFEHPGTKDSLNPIDPFTVSTRCSMQDIFWGVVIIGIGLVMGGSIFLGEFSLVNFIFDGLGMFFIGKGVVSMLSQNSG